MYANAKNHLSLVFLTFRSKLYFKSNYFSHFPFNLLTKNVSFSLKLLLIYRIIKDADYETVI